MALIQCPDCKTEVSDSASSCPKCARPISAAPAPIPAAAPPPAKRSTSPIALVVLVVIIAVVYYKFAMPKETKAMVNRVAAVTGVAVTPWIDRAETAVNDLLNRRDQLDIVGKSVAGICHPTGTYVQVEKHVVRKQGETLVVELQVGWKGGVLGTAYVTQVRWTCNKQGHIQAEVFGDTSMTGVAKDNARQLDDYFRTKVAPTVMSNAGG